MQGEKIKGTPMKIVLSKLILPLVGINE